MNGDDKMAGRHDVETMVGEYFRGFIAVEIEPTGPILDLLDALKNCKVRLKVVSSDKLHVTLKFLGDTPIGLVPGIIDAIEASAAIAPSFEIKICGVGSFPDNGKINVVWAGLDGTEILSRITTRLEEYLVPLGFVRERRPFSPHLTMARVKGSDNIGALHKLIRERSSTDFGKQKVDSILLKKSVLSSTGPSYSTLGIVKLTG